MEKERFLVTGGAGFIGSHLVEFLLSKGHQVRVLDNLSSGNKNWIPKEAELQIGDITDSPTCEKATQGIAGIFHLAAMSKAGPSHKQERFCLEQNVTGTLNLLLAAQKAGVKKLVYAGSSTYYGSLPPPHKEALPPSYLNPYGLSKYLGELECEFFTRVYGFSTISLRLFNVYGPRQPRSGPYGLVMGIFLDQAAKGETLEIHGTGEQRRDFVHVKDVAEAFYQAFRSSCHGMSLNVGSGKNYSVNELASWISKNQKHTASRPCDAKETLADISKTREFLNWSPKIDFEVGLRSLKAEL